MHRRLLSWRWPSRAGASRGQALILFALMLPVFIGIAGLALDAGNLYLQRRLLQRAADAAALAGAQVANFDPYSPAILPAGETQAAAVVEANGVAASEIVRAVSPPATGPYAAPFALRDAYIEVALRRTVDNPFMQLFGLGSSTIEARAVARAFSPGYGSPALLGLNPDSGNTINFNGCGAPGCNIAGDVVSRGGINAGANAVNIDGGAHALGGNIFDPAGNIDANGGLFDSTNNPDADPPDAADPTTSPSFAWPAWPAAAMSIVAATSDDNLHCLEYRDDPPGPDPPANFTDCDGDVRIRSDYSAPVPRSDIWIHKGEYSGSIRQDSGADEVYFESGGTVVNGSVTLNEDATIDADLWVKGNLTINGDATFNGRLKVDGTVTVSGNATFNGDVLFNGDLGVSGTAVLHPGKYDDVSISGSVEFATGVYDFRTLSFNGGAGWTAEPTSTTAPNGWDNSGVVFRLLGPSEDVPSCMSEIDAGPAPYSSSCVDAGIDVLTLTGNVDLNLHVLNRNTVPPLTDDPRNNTYNNIMIFAPFNSISMEGTGGSRSLDGSIYAPSGRVDIGGMAGTTVLSGQIIAWEVLFHGNGTRVNYYPGGPDGTFGPILVNTPDRLG